MMHGEFMDSNQFVVPLTLRGEGGREEQIEAIVDTGFTGSLVLPGYIIQELDLVQLDATR